MNLTVLYPEISILILALAVIVLDLLIPAKETRRCIGYIAVSVISIVFFSLFYQYNNFYGGAEYFYAGLFSLDNYAVFFKQLFLLGTALTIAFSLDYMENLSHSGEFIAMILFATLGMMVLSSANDFITMFVGMELMAISFYALTGFNFSSKKSSEAGIKYLIIGSISTAVLLYGISLIYATAGSMEFIIIAKDLGVLSTLGITGIIMVIVAIFFKMSVIPFHMWTPDVYEGAPAPVTALLSISSKAAAIAIFLRIFTVAFFDITAYLVPIIEVFSIICMVCGNIMAIKQRDIKRMLAYSAISQMGYILVGLCADNTWGIKGILFYLVIYAFSNIGAFAVITVIEKRHKVADYTTLSGLSKSSPFAAMVMTISLLSMAGIPPTGGFVGKLYLFMPTLEAGHTVFVLIAFVMSMVSVYYYLNVVKVMYLGDNPYSIKASALNGAVAFLSIIATLVLGIYPQYLAILTDLVALNM